MAQTKDGDPKSSDDKVYSVRAILGDKNIKRLSERLRAQNPKPCLRKMSSVMNRMPWRSPPMCGSDSLAEWLRSNRPDADSMADNDIVSNFADYLDWWENEGIYQDTTNKELKLLIRRMGLEEEEPNPPPYAFRAIQAIIRLTSTDSHPWMFFYGLLDCLIWFLELDCSKAKQFPPRPKLYAIILSSLTKQSPSFRVNENWLLATKASIIHLQNGVPANKDFGSEAQHSFARISGPSQNDNIRDKENVITDYGQDDVGDDASAQRPEEVAVLAGVRDSKIMNTLIRKMDKLTLTKAMDRLLPSIAQADGNAKYLAITMNIEIAAMTVGYILVNAKKGGPSIVLGDISKKMDQHKSNEPAWYTNKYVYQPLAMMLFASPLNLLYPGRMYSNPVQFSDLFAAWVAAGNMARPVPLCQLERDIWSMVLQVASGASVHAILPVYIKRWAGSIDSDDLAGYATWLKDLGLGPPGMDKERFEEFDEEDAGGSDRRSRSPVTGQKRPRPSHSPDSSSKRMEVDDDCFGGINGGSLSPLPSDMEDEVPRTGSGSVADEDDVAASQSKRPSRSGPRGRRRQPRHKTKVPGSRNQPETGPITPRPVPKLTSRFMPPTSSGGRSDVEEDMLADDNLDDREDEVRDIRSGQGILKEATPEIDVPFQRRDVVMPALVKPSDGLERVHCTPHRETTFTLFRALAGLIKPDVCPGSMDSGIAVMSDVETLTCNAASVNEVLRSKHILVKSTAGGDPDWEWGASAFSALRPIVGTPIHVQDSSAASFKHSNDTTTKTMTMGELIRAGYPGTGDVDHLKPDFAYSWSECNLGGERLVPLPFVSPHGGCDIAPSLLRVAVQNNAFDDSSSQVSLNWVTAATTGAETVQHIDDGGFGTVIHVLSGRKLWIVGTPLERNDFTNSSSTFISRDFEGRWDCVPPAGMKWEAVVLEPGDTFYQRPGTPHAAITLESSLVFGMYVYAPLSLVASATSFATTTLGHNIATNTSVEGSLSMLLSIASWWWNGDIALDDDDDMFDPAARACRPSLLDDPATYVAVLAICVFQTALSAVNDGTADSRHVRHIPSNRKSWAEAENLHQYIIQAGVLMRTQVDTVIDLSHVDRIHELRDIILDYGRAMLAMAIDLHRSDTRLNVRKFRQDLDYDVRLAYGLSADEWVDDDNLSHMPFIPSVTFVSDTRPDLIFRFESSS
ncbi:unnamed protein product [Peniophora sp. CBMAI 1063]|nr:unnamed protein product [Peniophora sp. CBMAI 1063]